MRKIVQLLVRNSIIRVVPCAVLFLSIAGQVHAQDEQFESLAQDDITVEQVDAAIDMVETRQGLQDDERDMVLEYMREARAQVQNRQNFELAMQEFADAIQTAPPETARLRESLDEQTTTPTSIASLGVKDDATLAELEQILAQELADFTAIESRLEELKAEVDAELVRPADIREQISLLRTSRDEITDSINEQEIEGELPLLSQARRFAARMTLAAQNAELAMLEQESLSHGVRLSLLQAQRDVAARAELEIAPRIELLRAAVNQKIQDAAVEAQRAAAVAELAVVDKHPVIRALASQNAELTKELPELAAASQELNTQLQQIKTEQSDIEQRLARSERRLEIGGLSRVLGSLMIAERRSLPPLSQYRAEIRVRNRNAAAIGLDRIRVQEERRELAAIDLVAQEMIAEVAEDISNERELDENAREIRQLLRVRRDLLLQVENSYGNYLQVLGNLDIEQRRLLDSNERYQQFLAQNLLWIPSAPIFGVGVLQEGLPDYPHSLTIGAWSDVGSRLIASVGDHVIESLLCLLILGSLLFLRRPLARQYDSMSARVGRLSSDNIGLTIASLANFRVLIAPVLNLRLSKGPKREAPKWPATQHIFFPLSF